MDRYKKDELDNFYDNTGLTSNMEDYVETIESLSSIKKVVRVKDIAKKLNIKMPSVTAALNKLREMDLIEYEKYGFIELTEKGKIIANKVSSKHSCMLEFFHSVLMIDYDNANKEACKVEHYLNPETYIQINKLLKFFKSEDKTNQKWIKKLKSTLIR